MPETTRHTRLTRLLHGLLALAVVVQLASSLGMIPDRPDRPGNLLFEVHESIGIASMALVLAFWLWSLSRRHGTQLGALFPWLSGPRRRALKADILRHITALRHLRMPAHQANAPLASAVHGLGLCLVTLMAGTGTLYLLSGASSPREAGLTMEVHEALGSVVWVYLVGHAGMGVLQHLGTEFDLRSMWSLRPKTQKD
ncbi:cytochrome b/b6 domain-containing protein [Alloyangia pacifica]|uniref:cytochrome b/b6 domain-containing protein n=1 Tax=Alloyangia pacifica TaxID=311180 RepID=UPI001CD5374B|nr:cytochrome b/b6 domain-containing protein [Alloyangia pacifica]MCA0994198.1 cytochrome b/b6 domain-containing protein [Alloyangia pacifica]